MNNEKFQTNLNILDRALSDIKKIFLSVNNSTQSASSPYTASVATQPPSPIYTDDVGTFTTQPVDMNYTGNTTVGSKPLNVSSSNPYGGLNPSDEARYEPQIQEMTKELDSKEAELEQARQLIAQRGALPDNVAEAQLYRYQARVKPQIERLSNEIGAQQDALERAKSVISKYEKDISNCNASVQAYEEKLQTCADTSAHNNNLKQTIERFAAGNRYLTKQNKDCAATVAMEQKRLEQQKRNNEQQSRERLAFEEKFKEANSRARACSVNQRQCKITQDKLLQKQAELYNELKQKAAMLSTCQENNGLKMRAVMQENNELKMDIDDMVKKMKDIDKEFQGAEDQFSKYSNIILDLKNQIEMLTNENKRLRTSLSKPPPYYRSTGRPIGLSNQN